MDDYYVYVYIDPRNFEEFYYGKGKGSRKDAHLGDDSDNEKARRIRSIRRDGLEPIIRVIAGGLSQDDAFLIETTLLWKLGKHLTNVAVGHYSEKFRPHDTFHKQLPGFDFQNSLYYYNVGEGSYRNWDDYVKFGFISGGHGPVWCKAMQSFNVGDLVAAYLKRKGFVGIGKITQEARPIHKVFIYNKPLLQYDLVCRNMGDNAENLDYCEYVALVYWIVSKDRTQAAWVGRNGLFTSRLLRASLNDQPKTVKFLEEQFSINFSDLLM